MFEECPNRGDLVSKSSGGRKSVGREQFSRYVSERRRRGTGRWSGVLVVPESSRPGPNGSSHQVGIHVRGGPRHEERSRDGVFVDLGSGHGGRPAWKRADAFAGKSPEPGAGRRGS